MQRFVDGEVELLLRAEEAEQVRLRDAGGARDVLGRGAVDSPARRTRASPRRARPRRRSSAVCLTCAVFMVVSDNSLRSSCQAKRASASATRSTSASVNSRVERQRQRPLERRVGARERALLAVGRQPVQRVRADLRLDPLRAQPGERLVAAVEPDDVGLPAVPVALGRGGRLDEVLEPLRVERRRRAPAPRAAPRAARAAGCRARRGRRGGGS